MSSSDKNTEKNSNILDSDNMCSLSDCEPPPPEMVRESNEMIGYRPDPTKDPEVMIVKNPVF